MKHRTTLLSAVAIAATAAVVAVGGAAYADILVVDGDTVTAGPQTSIDFGTVECGTTVSKTVAVSITRQSGGNVFADGAHVGFTAATGNTSLTVDPIAELTIPQGWGGSVKDTTTGPMTATVTLSAATAGTVNNAQVTFTASGASTKNGTYTTDAKIRYSWNVSACGGSTDTRIDTTAGIDCPTSVVYTGDPVEPCTAWVDGVGSPRQPLDVTYSDDHTNVGTVTASASYEGDATHKPSSASTTFEIAKARSDTTVTCPTDGIVFTGSAITPCTATVTGAGGLDQPVDVTYDDNVHVRTVTASAHYDGDRNHEASDGSATFSILAWTLSGFFKPVDMGPVLNIVKGGSTVPLKFTVMAGDTAVTDTATLGGTFTQTLVACQNTASMLTDDMSSFTTTGGTALRYDATGRQWVQNWQTPKTAGSCYTVTLQTADGSTLVAAFKTK